MTNSPESPHELRNTYIPTFILIGSAGISIVSALYIVGRALSCLVSLGCPASSVDVLAFVGVFNVVLFLPLAFWLGKGKINKTLLGVNVILATMALLPLLYIAVVQGKQMINKTVEPYQRAEEKQSIEDQVMLAKQANISVESEKSTVSVANDTAYQKEYDILTPLVFKNVPEGLQSFNLSCVSMYGAAGKDLSINYDVSCGSIRAVKNGSVWQYFNYDWKVQKEVESAAPILITNFRIDPNQVLPEINEADFTIYISSPQNKYSAGLLVEDLSVSVGRVPIILK